MCCLLMARSAIATAFLSVLALLPHGGMALHDSDKSMMRAEGKVSITPRGGMVHTEALGKHKRIDKFENRDMDKTPEEMEEEQEDDEYMEERKEKAWARKARMATRDMCDDDYLLGIPGTTKCEDPHKNTRLLDKTSCEQAAIESGATNHQATFDTKDPDDIEKFPQGCHVAECDEAANGVCYRFNANPEEPGCANEAKCKGIPVCRRPMYVNATPNMEGHCPSGYETMNDEAICHDVANCLDIAAGQIYMTGMYNGSKHRDHPVGCFIDNDDNLIYFNQETVMNDGSGTHGYNVRGTLICRPNASVHWKYLQWEELLNGSHILNETLRLAIAAANFNNEVADESQIQG